MGRDRRRADAQRPGEVAGCVRLNGGLEHWAPEVAKARSVIAAAMPTGHPDLSTHPSLDDHEALEYIRSVLHQLTDDSTAPSGSC